MSARRGWFCPICARALEECASGSVLACPEHPQAPPKRFPVPTLSGYRVEFCADQKPTQIPMTVLSTLFAIAGTAADVNQTIASVPRDKLPEAARADQPVDEFVLTARIGDEEYHVHVVRKGVPQRAKLH
jgi:hypothetical protein